MKGELHRVPPHTGQGAGVSEQARPGIVKGKPLAPHEERKVSGGEGRGDPLAGWGPEVIEYPVSEDKLEVVDIPTATHHIENTGDTDMVTVMWSSEPFDPDKSRYFLEKV